MNKDIMLYYIELVEFLGIVLGPSYEIVLYDLRREDKSIIAITNSQISGRSVGAPLTEVGLKTIVDKKYKDDLYKANYNAVDKDGNILRSSTLHIKDENNSLIGLLCVNFSDEGFKDLTEQLMSLIHPNELIQANNFERIEDIKFADESDTIGINIEEVAENALNKVLRNSNIPADRLNKNEKIEIVKTLNDRGIFMLKGSVPHVAKLLHSSEATIYRYLNSIDMNK